MKWNSIFLALIFWLISINVSAMGNHAHDDHGHDHTKAENDGHPEQPAHSAISNDMLEKFGVETATVSPRLIKNQLDFYGLVKIPKQRKTIVSAPYQSSIKKVFVDVGDKVIKGQKLVSLVNIKNLQAYQINSPASGLVTERWVNNGEIVQQGSLLKITNLSKIWVEFTVFPKNLSQLKAGQELLVTNLYGNKSSKGKIDYVLPTMTEGHLARARTTIDNINGNWYLGMHVMVKVTIGKKQVSLAVQKSALQNMNGKKVVFIKRGDTFEAQVLQTGIMDENYIEVLSGLESNMEYVVKNSFLIKADLLKHNADHGHAH
jgi:cobalt-zinc-cadmium efflux system membrane fusion protein